RWTAPDLARARAEVARSGTHGAHVSMITTDQTPDFGRQNLEAAATLRRLGYRVTVKHYPTDHQYFAELFGDSRHVDAAVNGWIGDYPAPSNFFSGIECPNSPYLCSAAYRRSLARATAAATSSGSNEPSTAFDRYATNLAAAVPFLNLKG